MQSNNYLIHPRCLEAMERAALFWRVYTSYSLYYILSRLIWKYDYPLCPCVVGTTQIILSVSFDYQWQWLWGNLYTHNMNYSFTCFRYIKHSFKGRHFSERLSATKFDKVNGFTILHEHNEFVVKMALVWYPYNKKDTLDGMCLQGLVIFCSTRVNFDCFTRKKKYYS